MLPRDIKNDINKFSQLVVEIFEDINRIKYKLDENDIESLKKADDAKEFLKEIFKSKE